MLEALCADPVIEAGGVLLLAPTGKAAVQLQARTGKPAKNLAQFLRKHQRWDWDSGAYYLAPGEARFQGAKTVVIDKSSMLTEEMRAATLDALAGVDRLILCGDPRQLPPIGAGRPFADLVAYLRSAPGPGGGVTELQTGRRQMPAGADDDRPPDDVAIASLFSLDALLPGRRSARPSACRPWGRADRPPRLDRRGRPARQGHPRAAWGEGGAGAENWQVLSPVRARPGGVVGHNELVRDTWRPGDVQLARKSFGFVSPAGADQVIFADKVMCLRNDHNREAWDPRAGAASAGSVANGEIGLVVWKAGKTPKGHKVEFSTQPERQYTLLEQRAQRRRRNGPGGVARARYAVTIHKSQGSQFRVTLVVVPDPCPLLSPELLYTALTRQQDKVILLKQGEVSALRRSVRAR